MASKDYSMVLHTGLTATRKHLLQSLVKRETYRWKWIIVQNTLQRGGQERRDNFAKEITPGGKSMGRWDKGRLFQMARAQRAGLWEARQWKERDRRPRGRWGEGQKGSTKTLDQLDNDHEWRQHKRVKTVNCLNRPGTVLPLPSYRYVPISPAGTCGSLSPQTSKPRKPLTRCTRHLTLSFQRWGLSAGISSEPWHSGNRHLGLTLALL